MGAQVVCSPELVRKVSFYDAWFDPRKNYFEHVFEYRGRVRQLENRRRVYSRVPGMTCGGRVSSSSEPPLASLAAISSLTFAIRFSNT